jgi:hypothetical protein
MEIFTVPTLTTDNNIVNDYDRQLTFNIAQRYCTYYTNKIHNYVLLHINYNKQLQLMYLYPFKTKLKSLQSQ